MSSAQTYIDAAALGVLYAVVAFGVALVFGVMRLVNFAYGELITTAAYVLYLTKGSAAPLRLALAVGAALAMALLMEVVFRPTRSASPATALIATFALSFALRALAVWVFGTQGANMAFLPQLNRAVSIGDVRIRWITLVALFGGVLLLAATAAVLRRTDAGLAMRATAADLTTARVLGVRVQRTMVVAFAASGLLAGVVTLALAVQRPLVTPDYGLVVMFPALVGVVVGGMERLAAATFGGFLVGFATVLLGSVLPSGGRVYLNSAMFGLVILVLLVRPDGLLASREGSVRL